MQLDKALFMHVVVDGSTISAAYPLGRPTLLHMHASMYTDFLRMIGGAQLGSFRRALYSDSARCCGHLSTTVHTLHMRADQQAFGVILCFCPEKRVYLTSSLQFGTEQIVTCLLCIAKSPMWKTYMRLPQRRWITANARRNGVKKVCWYAEAVGIDPRVYKPAKGVLLETPRLFFLWNLHLNINSALTRDSIPILPGYALLSEIDIRTVKYASYRDALSSPVRVEPLHKDAPYLALHVGSSPLPPVKPTLKTVAAPRALPASSRYVFATPQPLTPPPPNPGPLRIYSPLPKSSPPAEVPTGKGKGKASPPSRTPSPSPRYHPVKYAFDARLTHSSTGPGASQDQTDKTGTQDQGRTQGTILMQQTTNAHAQNRSVKILMNDPPAQHTVAYLKRQREPSVGPDTVPEGQKRTKVPRMSTGGHPPKRVIKPSPLIGDDWDNSDDNPWINRPTEWTVKKSTPWSDYVSQQPNVRNVYRQDKTLPVSSASASDSSSGRPNGRAVTGEASDEEVPDSEEERLPEESRTLYLPGHVNLTRDDERVSGSSTSAHPFLRNRRSRPRELIDLGLIDLCISDKHQTRGTTMSRLPRSGAHSRSREVIDLTESSRSRAQAYSAEVIDLTGETSDESD